MRQVLVAAMVALAVSITLTPLLIRLFTRHRLGQQVRADGPATHLAKQGTPTMGGIAILIGMWAGYLGAHLVGMHYEGTGPSASGLLVLGLATALGGVGFLDDYIKLSKRRSLGLTASGKYLGQLCAAVIFGVLALQFRGGGGLTPASKQVSIVRDITTVSLGLTGFLVAACLLVVAWSNAVNITDGLDGLAAGSMGLALGTYVLITFWQYTHACTAKAVPGCYTVRDPLDLAIVCAAGATACVGFLWWNAAPAKIIMGDTGALALGGLLAGLSITSRTELLMVAVGALFVAEILSVLLQIVMYRTTRTRLFKMAPFHHHFELTGWPETTVSIRFWLLAAIASATGLVAFYGEHLNNTGSHSLP
ncbi:phospho-N-acetylmuramoyl-pentapeptide-transferase [Nocardia seriolae]|uniref:Phospho-N-acetylmuramoyl-pentapeptide-transferase n=1 Tax=Nocardia seriolae TaxID=37332 RepID=A0A0B8N5T6_9NOCA|nr:phospho-N-acetylmuramoyl-pentapeptide-transferase [Nocardia seriolae]APA98859.1 Phospho-N-acetylmuramoyl-pentapeptide-transferase [Nocardia seriolae]MTJ72461.1 phospho-N-acetylmuramoyl-pentapeptide-transferase [Nocardia seriolae]MTJ88487.1 phospho-N-acetylmuramoyl-pentapeptide-transferase [Nocardia seriolae]MTK32469.1 phospho-N-acetylmuramoyl-pentapeptide-transferase [Nocardia seriolae]MTK41454.1 phospho-N-acetylmuramoyl-pentapeptide-transferase [Nocardia seriolae]